MEDAVFVGQARFQLDDLVQTDRSLPGYCAASSQGHAWRGQGQGYCWHCCYSYYCAVFCGQANVSCVWYLRYLVLSSLRRRGSVKVSMATVSRCSSLSTLNSRFVCPIWHWYRVTWSLKAYIWEFERCNFCSCLFKTVLRLVTSQQLLHLLQQRWAHHRLWRVSVLFPPQ